MVKWYDALMVRVMTAGPASASTTNFRKTRYGYYGLAQTPVFALVAALLLLSGCSGGQNNSSATVNPTSSSAAKPAQSKANAHAIGADDDADDSTDTSAGSMKNKPAKIQFSTKAKETGELTDTVIVQQKNEFLGESTLKLSKSGVRLESAALLVIMPPGKEAIAYNPSNGNCMALTSKGKALLQGNGGGNFNEGKETIKKIGSDKIAGLNCTHYQLHRDLLDTKTKEITNSWDTELWASKDLKLPASVTNDCAKIILMPTGLGFPVRIVRHAKASRTERIKGHRSDVARDFITTSSYSHSKVDKAEFALLPGFKTVTDEMQLMMVAEDPEIAGSNGLEDLDKDGKEPLRSEK